MHSFVFAYSYLGGLLMHFSLLHTPPRSHLFSSLIFVPQYSSLFISREAVMRATTSRQPAFDYFISKARALRNASDKPMFERVS